LQFFRLAWRAANRLNTDERAAMARSLERFSGIGVENYGHLNIATDTRLQEVECAEEMADAVNTAAIKVEECLRRFAELRGIAR